MPCLLKKVTVWLLKLKETETHSADLERGPTHSLHLDRKGHPYPSYKASVSLHSVLLEHWDFMAPAFQDRGDQWLHFQKTVSFLTTMEQEGLHRPDLELRRGPFLPYSQGHMGHLPTGTTGVTHPLTPVDPEEQHHPNLKNTRICMGKKGNSRTPHTMTWLGLLPNLKDQNKAHWWEAEVQAPSSLEAHGGLYWPRLKGPEVALLSLGVRGDHPLAILWVQEGHILVSLKAPGVPILISLMDPEAKHQISWQDPGEFSLSSLKSKG